MCRHDAQERPVGQCGDGFIGIAGIDLDTFLLGEVIQQRITAGRISSHQRGTRQVDDANHLLRGLQRPRQRV